MLFSKLESREELEVRFAQVLIWIMLQKLVCKLTLILFKLDVFGVSPLKKNDFSICHFDFRFWPKTEADISRIANVDQDRSLDDPVCLWLLVQRYCIFQVE